jgi:hypothetical protein
MTTATTSSYRLDILRHANRTHGGNLWVWALTSVDGDRHEGGHVDSLSGIFNLDGGDATAEAERVCDQVCHQCDIDRDKVLLTMEGRSW